MCIIASVPKGANIDKETLETMWNTIVMVLVFLGLTRKVRFVSTRQ